MFRFFRRENLRPTRRRSASCPNLEQACSTEENNLDYPVRPGAVQGDGSPTSESDSDEIVPASKFERLKAQRSIRRVRQKEKEKKENAERKLLSMDDYLGKLSDLKMWLTEERKKDVDNMKSPKMKTYFKTFLKLWNKKKLPPKYYRTCSVDLGGKEDAPVSPVFPDVMEQPATPRYPLVEDPATPSIPIFPPPLDLSAANMLENVDSPFSTFGKSPGDPLTSPAHLAQQVNVTPSVFTENSDRASKETNSKARGESNSGQSSSSGSYVSPQRFATISRSTPASSLYKFTAQPWSAKGDIKVHPVSSPKCPEGKQDFPEPQVLSNPSSKTLPRGFAPGYRLNQEDVDKLITGWNNSTRQSPIYSAVMDSIPFSTGSPEYAEIDEGLPSLRNNQFSSDYCSISPLAELKSPNKKSVKKNPSLNRRRSKSMEDIYAVPIKTNIFKVAKKPNFMEEEPDISKTPPVPEKLFSPKSLFSTFLGERGQKGESPKTRNINVSATASPSISSHLSPMKSPYEYSPQKRRSQETMESVQESNSPNKKVKSNTLSSLENCSNDSHQSMKHNESFASTGTPTNQEIMTPTKLSNLTGSLKPTTRNRNKEVERWKSPHSDELGTVQNDDLELSVLEVQELKESPKFPRRKLKRRSSSLTTTPGKGLTFGNKSFKKSTASPRRVSFAKDVKDTESKSTLRRKSSSRHLVQVNPGAFTQQTQDRLEFETFLSSHASPPKKSNSPSTSPHKNLTPNSSSHPSLIKKNLASEFRSSQNAESQERSPIHGSSLLHNDQLNANYMQPTTSTMLKAAKKDRIFPPSPTKQVGRRVIGAPSSSSPSPQKSLSLHTKETSPHAPKKPDPHQESHRSPSKQSPKGGNSPQRNLINQLKQLSPPKRLFGSQSSFSLAKKPIHSLVSRLGEKTSTLCANEVSQSDGYSSNDDMLNQTEPTKTYDKAVPVSYGQDKISSETTQSVMDGGESSEVCPMTVETVTIPPNQTAKSETLSAPHPQFVTTFTSENDPTLNPLSKKSGTNKDSSFEVLELDDSPGSKSKNKIQDTATAPSSDTSHSQLKINQEKPSFNHKVGLPGAGSFYSQPAQSFETKEQFTSTPLEQKAKETSNSHNAAPQDVIPTFTNTAAMPKLPASTDSQSNVTQLTQPQLISLPKEMPRNQSSRRSTDGKSEDCENYFGDDLHQFHTDDPFLDIEMDTFVKEAELFNKSLGLGTPDNDHSTKRTPRKFEPATESIKQEGRIARTTPDLKTACHKQAASKPNCKTSNGVEQITSKEIQSQGACFVKGNKNNSPNNLLSPRTTNDSKQNGASDTSSNKEAGNCSLKRLESIRASPKIVDNDGWITERRRSSRGKAQHSFRSAHNRYLLRSASKEEKEDQTEDKEAISLEPKRLYESDTASNDTSRENNVRCEGNSDAHYEVNSDGKCEMSSDAKCEVSSDAKCEPEMSSDVKFEGDSGKSLDLHQATTATNAVNKAIAQPTHQLHSTQKTTVPSPLKKKPAVLPKTAKASTFACKRLNVNQFVNSSSETKPRRRSSLVAKENLRRESFGKTQNRRNSKEGLKQCRRESQEVRRDSNGAKQRRGSNGSKHRRDSNVAKQGYRDSNIASASGRVSGGPKEDFIKRNINAVRRDSSKLTASTSKWSQYQQAGQGIRKRSSIGDSNKQKDRRRSKGKNAEDENKMPSFSERKKFFQQLQNQMDTDSHPQQLRSAFTHKNRQSPIKSSVHHDVKAKTSPLKTLKPEYKNTAHLALSPNSGIDV